MDNKKIQFIDLHIGNYRNIRGGCGFVKIPNKIKHKKAILNIKCYDEKCFLYSILAFLYPTQKNSNLAFKYKKYLRNLNVAGIKFPIALSSVKKFERINNLKINVYGWEENDFSPFI